MEKDEIAKAREEEAKVKQEEFEIQLDSLRKEYAALPKTDPKFMGIDLDAKEYWIFGNGWKIKKLGFSSKKAVKEYFDKHDNTIKTHDELDPEKDANERVELVRQMMNIRDEIIENCLPMLLTEMDGKTFNEKKWLEGDVIPAASWWDCARDCFLFLRGSGSREDILLSMMQSSSESTTTSASTKTPKKST